jgi:urocanate hydratase
MGGVARRAWAINENSIETTIAYNREKRGTDHITLPYIANENLIKNLVSKAFDGLGEK